MKKMYRQGDLLIKAINELPNDLLKKKDNVILKGGSTGHSHKLVDGEILLPKYGNAIYLRSDGGKIVHEEHADIELPEGVYLVKRQREFISPNEERYVYD